MFREMRRKKQALSAEECEAVLGRASAVEDDAGRRAAAELLAQKYCPEESAEGVAAEIDRFWRALCILELAPEHMSGKEAGELTRRRG